jgi:hypothetical protein
MAEVTEADYLRATESNPEKIAQAYRDRAALDKQMRDEVSAMMKQGGRARRRPKARSRSRSKRRRSRSKR